jgi:hypothetical protein
MAVLRSHTIIIELSILPSVLQCLLHVFMSSDVCVCYVCVFTLHLNMRIEIETSFEEIFITLEAE